MTDTQTRERYAWRIPPCPAYDVAGTESWLSDMAARGYILTSDGFFAGFAVFLRSEPMRCRYRLEAAPPVRMLDGDDQPGEEARSINEAYGWTYITRRGDFYIYRADGADEVREMHTDPAVQAMTLSMVKKRRRSALIAELIWFVVYPLLVFLRGGLMLTVLEIGTWMFLFGLALVGWFFADALREVVHLSRLCRKLQAGMHLDHESNWRGQAVRFFFKRAVRILLVLLWVVLMLAQFGAEIREEGELPLSAYPGTPPFATMRDFLPDGSYAQRDYGFSNVFSEEYDPLSDTIFWDEIADIRAEDGRVLSGGLMIHYHVTSSPLIARILAAEYRRDGRLFDEIEPIDLAGLMAEVDEVFAFRSRQTRFPTVVLRRGSTVIRAAFYQTSGEYTLSTAEWVSILAERLCEAEM